MLDIKEYLKQTRTVLVTQDAFDELVKKASAQRTGKWLECASYYGSQPTYVYSCSGCGLKSFAMHNFCPNCGARMEGEADDS